MNWSEFRQWATSRYGYQFGWLIPSGSEWRAIWGRGTPFEKSRANTGKGNPAEYGVIQQRRFAVWLRARDIVSVAVLHRWIDLGENRPEGWLVNDGSGIRWVAHPEREAHQLVERGFVAVKCGL